MEVAIQSRKHGSIVNCSIIFSLPEIKHSIGPTEVNWTKNVNSGNVNVLWPQIENYKL